MQVYIYFTSAPLTSRESETIKYTEREGGGDRDKSNSREICIDLLLKK